MPDTIINTLQQRRELEQAFTALQSTQTEAELVEAVRRLVFHYPTDLLLPALLKRLDTPSSQLRGGLARLAALLPPEETVPALRHYVATRSNPPNARMTAATILDRYLGEPLPEALIADLQGSGDAAFQSLAEAVDEGKRNCHVLLEYVTQMQQHDEEIATLVMDHLERLAAADRIPLLRLIAQDPRVGVAQSALRRLDALAAAGDRDALAALHSLRWTLPPKLATVAEHALRKAQLRGAPYLPPPATGWRALLSPAEPSGEMWLWLLSMPEEGATEGKLAGLLIQPERGVLRAHFVERVNRSHIPDRHRIGHLVPVPMPGAEESTMLEIPFDLGRALLQVALKAHWLGDTPIPLEGEYQLFNDWIWRFGKPTIGDDLQALVEEPWPKDPLSQRQAAKAADALLAQPSMRNWIIPSAEVASVLPEGSDDELPHDPAEVARNFLTLLAQSREAEEMLQSLSVALRMQSVWLLIRGESELSRRAHSLSTHMFDWRLEENPLVLGMTAKGMARLMERGNRHQEP